MFEPHLQSTGREYTTTVALLAAGFIFSPALLVLSRPAGEMSYYLAIACSALFVTLARVTWKKSLQLPMPSIATQRGEAK